MKRLKPIVIGLGNISIGVEKPSHQVTGFLHFATLNTIQKIGSSVSSEEADRLATIEVLSVEALEVLEKQVKRLKELMSAEELNLAG